MSPVTLSMQTLFTDVSRALLTFFGRVGGVNRIHCSWTRSKLGNTTKKATPRRGARSEEITSQFAMTSLLKQHYAMQR